MAAEDAAATPGPWERGWEHETMAQIVAGDTAIGSIRTGGSVLGGPTAAQAEANHALVLSARTDRPALVEMVRLLYGRAKTMTAARIALAMDSAERLQAEAAASELDALFETLWSEAKRKAGK